MSTPKATVIGLLSALEAADIGAFAVYMDERWFASGRPSYAENLFGQLCDRGLAVWGAEGVHESYLTDAGRAWLKKLRARKRTIEIRRVGRIEVGPGYRRLVDAYAVFVNGRERQPWMTKRNAQREARALKKM